jgi:hypothetical protein
MLYLFSPWAGKAQQMKNEHINNRKLAEVVKEISILEPAEVEHLGTCDECLDMLRFLIRQNLTKNAGAS